MMAENHRSMMNVVESAKRCSETGHSMSVPNEVIQSPTIWMRMPPSATP